MSEEKIMPTQENVEYNPAVKVGGRRGGTSSRSSAPIPLSARNTARSI